MPRTASELHTTTWCAWTTGVLIFALSSTNPLYLVLLLLSVILVGVLAPRDGGSFAGLKAVVLFGISMAAIAVVVASLNGSYGGHTLFTLPGPSLPSWMGGLRLGGPVSAEAIVAAGIRSLAIFCVFLAFAIFNSAVSVSRLMRSAPAALYHLGIIVTVGMTLLPSTVDDLARIREVRKLRGAPGGVRDLPGLVVPALLAGLERSMRLAEAMEARGTGPRMERQGVLARSLALVTAPLLLAATWIWFYATGQRWLGGALFLLAMAALAAWFRQARHTRTRFRDDPAPLMQRAAIVALLGGASLAFIANQGGWWAMGYNPFADLPLPGFEFEGAILAGLASLPAALILWPARQAPAESRIAQMEVEPR